MRAIILIVLGVLAADRISKVFFLRGLSVGESVPVIKGYFNLTLVMNKGAAFGMFQGQLLFFVLATVTAVIFILIHIKKSGSYERAALSLILGGALGNLIDRLFIGSVVDFLDFHIEPYFYWPVFNIADIAITSGACMIGLALARSAFIQVKK